MKRFAILRDNDPAATRTDVDAMAMQTIINLRAPNLGVAVMPRFVGVDWVRSYWQEGNAWGVCLYEAPGPQPLVEYHDMCGPPYVEFREIAEFTAPGAEVTSAGTTALSEGETLFTIETTLEADEPRAASFASLPATLTQAAGGLEGSLDHVRWVRAYWDGERRRALSLYVTREAATVEALSRVLEPAGAIVRPVTEIAPGEYLG